MINEHDRVVLNVGVPQEGLKRGDVGVAVHVYKDTKAYKVEFVALDGHTAAVVTLQPEAIRSVTSHDITHARELNRV